LKKFRELKRDDGFEQLQRWKRADRIKRRRHNVNELRGDCSFERVAAYIANRRHDYIWKCTVIIIVYRMRLVMSFLL